MKKIDMAGIRKNNIRYEANRPVLDIFRDHLSWENLLIDCYIDQKFVLNKSGKTVKGIKALYEDYHSRKAMITGSAGNGKTTALKYLYIKENDTNGEKFYYVSASVFHSKMNSLSEYEKYIRKAVEKNIRLNGMILLDGLEEEYINNYEAAGKLLQIIGKNINCIWVACRKDFYHRLDSSVEGYFDEIAEIQTWEKDEGFKLFLEKYVKRTGLYGVKERVNTLIKNSAIEETSVYCPLYATMFVFIAAEDERSRKKEERVSIRDEYDLIKVFISLWIEREAERQRVHREAEYYIKQFRKIALDTYENKCPVLPEDDNVVKGLLRLSVRKGNRVEGFCHREFLVYFIVDGMLDAALRNADQVVYWFSQTFYDDVTNLCKTALNHFKESELLQIYGNLFEVYRNSYDQKNVIAEVLRKNGIGTENLDFLKLRDEILYFIMKLPNVNCDDFFDFAHRNCDHTMISLGLAYGMAGIRQHPQTLEFARKLVPGSEEEMVNRSWAVCFFGDVSCDGYLYQDNKNCPWERAKAAKFKRMRTNTEKAYRYRLLDIPLIYCFYASRNFRDCVSFKDYKTILNCDISFGGYTDEEKQFLSQQKNQLVQQYKEQLLLNKAAKNPGLLCYGKKEKEACLAGLDRQREEQIMEQIELTENVEENLKAFWNEKGEGIRNSYREKLTDPLGKTLLPKELNAKLKQCKVLILTANYVEGVTVTRCLMQHNQTQSLERIVEDKHIYQFSRLHGVPVVHIWPQGTSSFTIHGSFKALTSAFKRFVPDCVFAVGVAFGADSVKQRLGDVLIGDHLVFYDSFNKITDGKLQLSADEVQLIGESILAGFPFLKDKKAPSKHQLGDFSWHLGSLLTGGTVLSDMTEKARLIRAANAIGREIVGGEMEGSGIYFACNGVDTEIPFTIIKGICDWGVNKNGWGFVSDDKEKQDEIKDCVQAFACENAFRTLSMIVSQMVFEL